MSQYPSLYMIIDGERVDGGRRRTHAVVNPATGEVIGQSRVRPVFVPGEGIEFAVPLNDGRQIVVQLPPRPRGPGEGPPPMRPWMRGTSGLMWMLAVVAVAVAIGTYPIVRRLTQRLEGLSAGVERLGGGDLGAGQRRRVPLDRRGGAAGHGPEPAARWRHMRDLHRPARRTLRARRRGRA